MIEYHLGQVGLSAFAPALPAFACVVAGIDFSPVSLAAARWAFAHVALQTEAIVAHVVPTEATSPPQGVRHAEVRARLHNAATLHGALGGFAATLPVAAMRTVIRNGRPSRALSDLASETGASLVVLGRRTDARRRGIGEPNVLERIARRTTASVLVVPDGVRVAPRQIIVGIDRSAMAADVLAQGRALAEINQCPLIVVHVVEPTAGEYDRGVGSGRRVAPAPAPSVVGLDREERLAIDRWMIRALAHDPRSERATVHVVSGDPARELAALAGPDSSAVIVVGKHGDDGAPNGSIGSVARELLLRARVPVVVVGDRDATGADPHRPAHAA